MAAPDNTASAKTREQIAAAYRSDPWWYDVRGFFILTFAYNSTLPGQMRFFGANFGSGAGGASAGLALAYST